MCLIGTDKTLADVIIHKYNVEEGGNVNPRMDPHGELINQNVLTEIPEKVTSSLFLPNPFSVMNFV